MWSVLVWVYQFKISIYFFFWFSTDRISLLKSGLDRMKACCSLLQPEEGNLILLYTCRRAGSGFLWANRRSSTEKSTMMESGTRSVHCIYINKNPLIAKKKKKKEKWNTLCLQVMFSLEKKKFRLVVDGIRAQDGQLTNAELSSMKQQFLSPVYLGSTPHSLHKELKV